MLLEHIQLTNSKWLNSTEIKNKLISGSKLKCKFNSKTEFDANFQQCNILINEESSIFSNTKVKANKKKPTSKNAKDISLSQREITKLIKKIRNHRQKDNLYMKKWE